MIEYINLLDGINHSVPLQFQNELTQYEILVAMQTKVNMLIDIVNSMEDNSNKYTDEQIKLAKDEINSIITLLRDNMIELYQNSITHSNSNYSTLKSFTISEIEKAKVEQGNNLDTKVKEINLIIDIKYNDLLSKIKEQGALLICPVDGQYETTQVILQHIYNMLRNNVLTCDELDALKFTCDEFEALQIDCDAFDINNKTLLSQFIS